MLPPPKIKTAGRYACGRPSVKVSIDSSTHQERRGFPNGAIACCDCLVNARLTMSKAPSDNLRVKLPANKKAAGSSPAASVSLLTFPVACYILPPPRTKTAGRYACGRPRISVSIDSSTHQDRRGFPNGAIVRCDCLVNARVTMSKAPLTTVSNYHRIIIHVKSGNGTKPEPVSQACGTGGPVRSSSQAAGPSCRGSASSS
jgi:hypothetical protein